MDNKLFRLFGGKHVNIIMKNVKGSQAMSDGSVIRGNVVIEGYLLDEDNLYLYIGSTLEESNEALQKSDVIRIFTAEPEGATYIDMIDNDSGSMH